MKLATIGRGGAAILAGLTLAGAAGAQDEQKPNPQPQVKPIAPPSVDPAAKIVEVPHEDFRKQFRDWPQFPGSFSLQEQLLTYRKEPVFRERPILNFWRKMYAEGPLDSPASFFGESNLFGRLNPTTPHLMVYGDARTAAGYSKNQDNELARIATRLNLDIDLQMTATERIHAFIRPFEKGASIMNTEFGGADGGGGGDDFVLDAEPDTLFFEGDLGPIMQGISGVRNSKDMPFAIGKIPLFLQNGVWLEDAFVGAAFSIPAMNSPRFDISNMDVTFFGGFDDVSSGAMLRETPNEGGTKLLGATTFIETLSGYAEIGYGHAENERDGPDLSSHSFTAAWTRRYWNWLTNSLRVIFTVGENTEDGALFLCENSFRTRQPYTLLPYFNMFVGVGSPESLARDAGAGGVLKNTGINFEADALTLFPKLNDTGHDRLGAALGIEFLPDLFTAKHRQQLVLEIAALHSYSDEANDLGDEIAIGARYQIAITNSWIFRCDVMAASVEDGDERSGFRVEVRKKW